MLREDACLCACVCRCTHDRIRISAITIGKSSEPFITLIPTLILNRRHELPSAAQKTRSLFVSSLQKIYEQSAFACYVTDTPDHSESFRHACPLTYFSHSLADRILLQQRDIVVKCHVITGALIFNLFVFM